jgi:prepilin-type processing-associated H-X9-DG protein
MTMRWQQGFTIMEFAVVIGTLALLLLMVELAARGSRCGPRGSRIQCVSNQKQIALAFRMWAADHADRFPMELTLAEGGTKELALQGLPLASFAIISNELAHPKPLWCPDDKKRSRVTDFGQFTPKNLSYFLGVNASVTNPASILAGDRNVNVNAVATNGFVQLTKPATVTWGPTIHKRQGNMVFADGSAHQATDLLLQKALRDTGLATNRFAIP